MSRARAEIIRAVNQGYSDSLCLSNEAEIGLWAIWPEEGPEDAALTPNNLRRRWIYGAQARDVCGGCRTVIVTVGARGGVKAHQREPGDVEGVCYCEVCADHKRKHAEKVQ